MEKINWIIYVDFYEYSILLHKKFEIAKKKTFCFYSYQNVWIVAYILAQWGIVFNNDNAMKFENFSGKPQLVI